MTAFIGFPRDSHSYSADEVGRAFAGLVQREPDGTPRVGMLSAGPTIAAVAASWKVQVGIFTYVHQVSGAVQFSGLSDDEQVDITPATGIPSGQARIDLVCWNQDDAELVVIDGVPATSPVVPSDGGLAPVFTVRVNSGDGMVIQGQVAPAYATTDLVGSAGVEGVFTPGTGWTPVEGEENSLERIGRVCYLNVSLQIAASGAFTSILTVPEGFRPAKDVFVGYAQVSGGPGKAHGQLWLRPTGVLQMRYYQGSTVAGNILPVSALWRLPQA